MMFSGRSKWNIEKKRVKVTVPESYQSSVSLFIVVSLMQLLSKFSRYERKFSTLNSVYDHGLLLVYSYS